MAEPLDNIIQSILAFSIIEICISLIFVFIIIIKLVTLNTTKFVKSVMYIMLLISILEMLIGGASLSIYFIFQDNNGFIKGQTIGTIFLLEKFINNLCLIIQSILIGNLCHKWISTAHKIEGKYYEQTFGQLKMFRNIFFAALSTLCVFQFVIGFVIYFVQKNSQTTPSVSSDCAGLQNCINITQKHRHLLNVSSSFNVLNNLLLISIAVFKFICGKKLQKSMDTLKQLSNIQFKTWKFKGIYMGAFTIIITRCIIELVRQGYQFYVVNSLPCICEQIIYGFTLYYIIYQIIQAPALGLVFGAINPIPRQIDDRQLSSEFEHANKDHFLANFGGQSIKEAQLTQIGALKFNSDSSQVSARPRVTQI